MLGAFCVFFASWRHALRSEWPFINNIIHSFINNGGDMNNGGMKRLSLALCLLAVSGGLLFCYCPSIPVLLGRGLCS